MTTRRYAKENLDNMLKNVIETVRLSFVTEMMKRKNCIISKEE